MKGFYDDSFPNYHLNKPKIKFSRFEQKPVFLHRMIYEMVIKR